MLGHFGKIRHNFTLAKHKDWNAFPLYALEKYPALAFAATRRKLTAPELELIAAIKERLARDHYHLRRVYEEDPSFIQQVAKPLEFLEVLTRKYPYPPRNAWELNHAFAAAEEVMIILNV